MAWEMIKRGGDREERMELKEKLESRLREGLIKDFNKLYVKEYTTMWEIERVVRETEIDIMTFDNTIKNILSLVKVE